MRAAREGGGLADQEDAQEESVRYACAGAENSSCIYFLFPVSPLSHDDAYMCQVSHPS